MPRRKVTPAPNADTTESSWQSWVTAQARQRGIDAYHVPDSERVKPGLPDLILAGRGVAFAELKSPRGILRDEQRRFINRAGLGGIPVHVWAPGDEVEVLAALDALALEPAPAPAPEADAGDDGALPDVTGLGPAAARRVRDAARRERAAAAERRRP